MTTAAQEIAKLDRFLAKLGQDVVLQRVFGAANQSISAVGCRAFVRKARMIENELIAGSGVAQDDEIVTMSSTQIDAAQWPGGLVATNPPATVDPRIPRRGDRIVIAGRARTVKLTSHIFMGNDLVRLDILVEG
jgi:hypothetical protein